MPSRNPVTVEGLTELRKKFKNLEDFEASKQLRKGLFEAAKIVSTDARTRVPVRSGRARASIMAGATANKAYVAGGRGTVKYYGWLDFGSRNPVSGRPRKVGPWKKSGRGPDNGRFIYAALDDKRDEVVARVAEALVQFEKEAGLE